MIGHGDGEPLDRRVARRPLRYSPTLQHAADLKPEVPMQVARVMLLHNEPRSALLCARHLFTSTLCASISLSAVCAAVVSQARRLESPARSRLQSAQKAQPARALAPVEPFCGNCERTI